MSERQWRDTPFGEVMRSLLGSLPDIARCKRCDHPMTAHTDAGATIPFQVCARMIQVHTEIDGGLTHGGSVETTWHNCGCRLLAGVND